MTVIPASLALFFKKKDEIILNKVRANRDLRLIVFHHGRRDIRGSDNMLLILDGSLDYQRVIDVRDQTIQRVGQLNSHTNSHSFAFYLIVTSCLATNSAIASSLLISQETAVVPGNFLDNA